MNKIAIIDAHQDLFWAMHHKDERIRSQTNIEMIKRNLKIVHLSIFLDNSEVEGASQKQLKEATLRQLHWYKDLIENDSKLFLIESKCSLETLNQRHDLTGVVLHFEGAESVDSQHFVDQLFELGVRSIGLVWNRKNLLASPAKFDDGDGLTPLGKQVVMRMIHHGMIIDVAHLNESGVYDVSEICEHENVPFINSHANCKSVCEHVRNASIEQLHMIKKSGGVIGLSAISAFCSSNQPVTLEDWMKHVQYLKKHIGITHIGLGSDFGGILTDSLSEPIVNFGKTDDFPNLVEMLQSELNDVSVEQILWHNWHNIYRRVLR